MLKYLFEVEFKDGTFFHQDKEDISHLDPKRSQFYDILQKGLENVKIFQLVNNEHIFSVNLEDGHFEIDEVPFVMHEIELTNFRLIYLRRTRIVRNQIVKTQTGQVLEIQDTREITYRMGWQANKVVRDDKGNIIPDTIGENIQQVMEFK